MNCIINFFRVATYSTFQNLMPLKFPETKNLSAIVHKAFLCNGSHGSYRGCLLSQKTSQNLKLTSCKSIHTMSVNGQGSVKSILEPPPFQKYSLGGFVSVRTKVREYFPRPSEIKRIKKHGWKKRMSTKAGREVIMRRILKGRHCITH